MKHVRIVYICLRFYLGWLLIKKPLGGWSSEVGKSLSLPRTKVKFKHQ